MIHKPWATTTMLVAAPTAPSLLAVTVNSRLGPGLGARRPQATALQPQGLPGASTGRTG